MKEGYKKTEVGIVPNEWKVKKIGELTEIKTGGTPSKEKEEYWSNGSIPWMVSGDINKKIIRKVDGRITELGLEKSAAKLLTAKTVMIALNGQGKTKGTVAYLETEVTCNQSLAGFIPNDNYYSKYLYYNLQSRYFEIRNLAGDEARNGLNLGLLRDIYVPLPSYKEQQKIAEILSTVDSQIDDTDKLIEKTKELKNGLMQRLLTKGIGHKEFKMTEIGEIPVEWKVKKLKDLGQSIIGLTYSPEDLVGENGTLVLRSSNIEGNKLVFSNNKYVNKEIQDKLITRENDILICSRNGSRNLLGKCALINKNAEGLSFGAFMTVYRGKYNKFLFHVFNSYMIKRQIFNNLGATINQITTDNMNNFKVPFPNIEEQEEIAKILSSVDTQIEEYENKKSKLEELKKGLMQQLLIGRIRVV